MHLGDNCENQGLCQDKFISNTWYPLENTDPLAKHCLEHSVDLDPLLDSLMPVVLNQYPALCQLCVVKNADLSVIKREIIHKIYPVVGHGQSCTMLLVTNLAQPEWISVSCTRKLLLDIICIAHNTSSKQQPAIFQTVQYFCGSDCVKSQKACYTFVWYNSTKVDEISHIRDCHKPLSQKQLQNVSVLLQEAISAALPLILAYELFTSTFNTIHVEKHHSVIQVKLSTIGLSTKGYLVGENKLHSVKVSGNVFSLGGFVLQTQVCNGNQDCISDSSDEDGCLCNKTSTVSATRKGFCKFLQTDSTTSCGLLFRMSTKGVCLMFSAMVSTKEKGKVKFTVCPSGEKIPQVMINDMISDCESGGDEKNLFDLLKHDTYQICKDPSKLPCWPGLDQCFPITKICFFKLDDFGRLTPCRNGGNLQQCDKYDCNYNFKCPLSYCIGWSDVCDSKWDCTNDADEDSDQLCEKIPDVCRYIF